MWNGACPFWNVGSLGWIGLTLNLLILLALIAGAIYLIRWIIVRSGNYTQGAGSSGGPAAAIRIAQDRYARGEISREDYLNLVEDLH